MLRTQQTHHLSGQELGCAQGFCGRLRVGSSCFTSFQAVLMRLFGCFQMFQVLRAQHAEHLQAARELSCGAALLLAWNNVDRSFSGPGRASGSKGGGESGSEGRG